MRGVDAVSGMLLLFPGQGSQSVGMGRYLWEEHEAAAAVFEEAEDLLHWDVRRLISGGSLAEITRTDRVQPLIFTCSIATWRVLQTVMPVAEPPVALGHSLGEYSALVAAGHLAFAQCLEVVRRRGLAMWESGVRRPGAMAAVLGLPDAEVESLCAECGEVWPANYNATGQVVVSGSPSAVAAAGDLALARGAKRFVPLQVSGAFHSPFMDDAAEGLRQALTGVDFGTGNGVRYFSTTEVRSPEPKEMKEVLVRQMTAPVRFVQSLQVVLPQVDQGVEVGPGSVLAGLVKRVSRSLSLWGTGDAAALGATLDHLSAAPVREGAAREEAARGRS
jgi:[acyl-carrier-protein] S-malonyltransferase